MLGGVVLGDGGAEGSEGGVVEAGVGVGGAVDKGAGECADRVGGVEEETGVQRGEFGGCFGGAAGWGIGQLGEVGEGGGGGGGGEAAGEQGRPEERRAEEAFHCGCE